MAKYSIITPQFNSFELMDKYFDSLLNQTVKDFEVVIVDDCSTDGSWKKLQEYVRQCPYYVHYQVRYFSRLEEGLYVKDIV